MPLIEMKSYRVECDTCHYPTFYFDRVGPEQALPDGWKAVPLYGPSGLEDYRFTCKECLEREGNDDVQNVQI